MTLGGLAVASATVLIAAFDGGLTAFITALAIGGGAYATTRKSLNAIPERVLAVQAKIADDTIQRAVLDKVDDAKIKAMRQASAKDLEKMQEDCARQRWGNKDVATVVGLAAFAYPPLGLVTLAGSAAVKAGVFDPAPVIPRVNWESVIKQALATP